MAQEGPKIQIDSDWKKEAQAEKQKLAEQAKASQSAQPAAGGAGPAGQIPAASFDLLVKTMATQALLFMGAVPDPRSGQRIQNLDVARHHIDLLTVIDQKTKGNLTEEEASALSTTLYELRSTYIQMSAAGRAR